MSNKSTSIADKITMESTTTTTTTTTATETQQDQVMHDAAASATSESVEDDDSREDDDFDDAIHRLTTFPRPRTEENVEQLRELVKFLVQSCTAIHPSNNKSDPSPATRCSWKRFLLTLIHKRYHLLAPEAKQKSQDKDKDKDDSKNEESVGDGERRLFYCAIQEIFTSALDTDSSNNDSGKDGADEKDASKAFGVLVRLAPLAGGSRDLCAILTDSMDILRTHSKEHNKELLQAYGLQETSVSLLAGKLVKQALDAFQDNRFSVHHHLDHLIQTVADTLDKDLKIIQNQESEVDSKDDKLLPSTLHVFLPHHGRGRPNNSKKRKAPSGEAAASNENVPHRQVVQTAAEILIWSRTQAAARHDAFQASYQKFLRMVSENNKDGVKAALQVMQTIVRKEFRKPLNDYARDQGFMLTNEFAMNQEQRLNMSKISRGKAGDINALTNRATKVRSAKVLQMIHLRFSSNPSKITRYASVRELYANWLVSESSSSSSDPMVEQDDDDDDLKRLELEIQHARLKATVAHLRKLFKTAVSNMKNKGVVVSSLESDKANHMCATLVVAAMMDWDDDDSNTQTSMNVEEGKEKPTCAEAPTKPKLFLAGTEYTMSSFEECVKLVDAVVRGLEEKNQNDAPSFMDEDHVATTKAVMNMIDRHVADNETMILVTAASLSFPHEFMQGLSTRGGIVHCHDADDVMGERLQREKARAGDITISLAWDTYDDLDLHVFLPSGEKLYFGNKTSRERDDLCLDVDMNAGGGCSLEPVENVFLGSLEKRVEAPKGEYKVVVENYAYHTADHEAAIPFEVVVTMNGTKQRYTGMSCQGSGEASQVVVCTFSYEGRTVPFPLDLAAKEAFGTSNLVNVTSSTGQTLESLGNLVQVVQQHAHLDEVRKLDNANDDSADSQERPVVAEQGVLEVTNRDRHDILLAKLPQRFHWIVEETFGDGMTLVEQCAKALAQRMVAEKIPLSELKKAGYPQDYVLAIKQQLAAVGAAAGGGKA